MGINEAMREVEADGYAVLPCADGCYQVWQKKVLVAVVRPHVAWQIDVHAGSADQVGDVTHRIKQHIDESSMDQYPVRVRWT